jgi:hypothetical protein
MSTTMTAARPRPNLRRGARSWFRLDRHDVRSQVPAAIRAMLQNGILDRVFRDALVPGVPVPDDRGREPWQGGLGDTKTFTRKGLLTPCRPRSPARTRRRRRTASSSGP